MLLVLTLTTAAINLWAAVADFSRARFVLGNASELDLPLTWLPGLGALKAAGAAGLLLGLAGVPLIGTAAAAGLVLFFAGAVGIHVWKRVFHNMAYPGVFLALAIAVLVLDVAGQGIRSGMSGLPGRTSSRSASSAIASTDAVLISAGHFGSTRSGMTSWPIFV